MKDKTSFSNCKQGPASIISEGKEYNYTLPGIYPIGITGSMTVNPDYDNPGKCRISFNQL